MASGILSKARNCMGALRKRSGVTTAPSPARNIAASGERCSVIHKSYAGKPNIIGGGAQNSKCRTRGTRARRCGQRRDLRGIIHGNGNGLGNTIGKALRVGNGKLNAIRARPGRARVRVSNGLARSSGPVAEVPGVRNNGGSGGRRGSRGVELNSRA